MKSLLKIPRKAELGLLIVSELAERHEDGQPVSLEVISEKVGVSRKFLEEIAGQLRKAELIEGKRGAAGGYVLRRKPATMTVAEVMTAVMGSTSVDACSAHQGVAEQNIWTTVRGQIASTLMNTTIADVIR